MSRRLTNQQKRLMEERREQILSNEEIEGALSGRVISQHGQHVTLEDQDLNLHKAAVRQSLGAIVCGDYVYYILEQNEPVVTIRLPRNNHFSRIAFGGAEKILAANIDKLYIVIAPKPEPSPSLIDRYLIAARYFEIDVAFIVNKKDEITDSKELAFLQDYQKLGLKVHYTSTYDPDSITELNHLLTGKTSIFVGQSGVGKSSLTNKLIPELELQTQKINASTGLGNHTTSSTTLYHLPMTESYLIDSPGVRSFNIEHLPLDAIDNGFPEFKTITEPCRFSNCSHGDDPGCSFQAAIAEGLISQRRLDSYLQIKSSMTKSIERQVKGGRRR